MSMNNIINEPVKEYLHGSEERKSLLEEYKNQSNKKIEIPIIIGGEKVFTGNIGHCICLFVCLC